MALQLATILDPADLWVAVLLVAGWLILMCLKTIGHEIDQAVRWHNLRIEAHHLRAKQLQRLKALGLKSKG